MDGKDKYVMKIASSDAPLEALLAQVNSINKGKSTIQIFDPTRIVNRIHLTAAYINALEAFKNKSNMSKSIAMEMLLFAAMTKQIGQAVELAGAKSRGSFIIFANEGSAYEKIKRNLSSSKDFKPTKKEELAGAKRVGINQTEDLGLFIMQKIALSRLEA